MPASVARFGRPAPDRILLVDDDAAVRGAIHRALSQAGLHVTQAEDVESATGLLDDPEGFDLLVTDMHMPGGRDGIVLARDWRTRAPGRPVLFVSGSGDARLNDGLGQHDAVMPKPLHRADLVATVRRLLAGAFPG